MTLAAQIRAHPAVELLEMEPNNGWWAYLREGYINGENQTVVIHEDTLTKVKSQLRYVRPKTDSDPT